MFGPIQNGGRELRGIRFEMGKPWCGGGFLLAWAFWRRSRPDFLAEAVKPCAMPAG